MKKSDFEAGLIALQVAVSGEVIQAGSEQAEHRAVICHGYPGPE